MYFLKQIKSESKRAPLYEIYKTKYNSEIEDIFITCKRIRNFLKEFILEDMKFDFLPTDLHYCLCYNEEIREKIRDYLVNKKIIQQKFQNKTLNLAFFLRKTLMKEALKSSYLSKAMMVSFLKGTSIIMIFILNK